MGVPVGGVLLAVSTPITPDGVEDSGSRDIGGKFIVTQDNHTRQVAAALILAAGAGTRMKSARPKVLHEVCGRSMISHAVSAAAAINPEHLVVVVGHDRDTVTEHLGTLPNAVTTAIQEQQLGTGHAVASGLAALGDLDGEVVVTFGDVPMLEGSTLEQLVETHRAHSNAVTVLTATVDDPTGYGRILRDGDGQLIGSVEDRDCSAQQRAITEINSGIYVFQAQTLREGLDSLTTDNAQAEQYLPDVIAFALRHSQRVGAFMTDDSWQTQGVNDRVQLSQIASEMNRRICHRWMREGVTIVDPHSTWIDLDVSLGRDVVLMPGTILQGATTVHDDVTIGPDTTLHDVEVQRGAEVVRSHVSFAIIGQDAVVGPYSYVRPGTQLGSGSKIGAFVETKKALIGANSKVPHLSYVGDASIDDGVNIGAGTIFANYDGVRKSHTHVGTGSFVGSNSVLVAPVDIAPGSFVAAGSCITEDVHAGELAVGRGRQSNIPGWVTKRRPGSPAEAAAQDHDGGIHPLVEESRIKLKKG